MLRFVPLALLALPATAQTSDWISAESAAGDPAPVPFVGGVSYAYDDGTANVNIGPPSSFDPDMLWGNYYETQAGGEVITEISVAFGATFPSGGPVTFWLLDDPDADGDPRNATALTSVEATPNVSGNDFFTVAIPPTRVSGAFFVGASAMLQGGEDRPARVDTDARSDRSWFFYDGAIADVIDDLASAAFGTRMDDPANVPYPGAYMVRASGQPLSTDAEFTPAGAALQLSVLPHPATASARLHVDLPSAGGVRVEVLDALGRTIARVHDGSLGAGTHAFALPTDLAPGAYVARVQTESGNATKRFVRAR